MPATQLSANFYWLHPEITHISQFFSRCLQFPHFPGFPVCGYLEKSKVHQTHQHKGIIRVLHVEAIPNTITRDMQLAHKIKTAVYDNLANKLQENVQKKF